MKLPPKIPLLGRDIVIEEQEEAPKNEKGETLAGFYDHANRRIIIHSDQTDLDRFETLCHEAAHNYLIQLGLDQKMDEREVEVWCQVFTLFASDIIRGLSQDDEKATGRKKKSVGKVGKGKGGK